MNLLIDLNEIVNSDDQNLNKNAFITHTQDVPLWNLTYEI